MVGLPLSCQFSGGQIQKTMVWKMYDLSNMAIVVYLDVKFQAGKFLKKYQARTTFSIPAVKQTKTFGNNQIKMS